MDHPVDPNALSLHRNENISLDLHVPHNKIQLVPKLQEFVSILLAKQWKNSNEIQV